MRSRRKRQQRAYHELYVAHPACLSVTTYRTVFGEAQLEDRHAAIGKTEPKNLELSTSQRRANSERHPRVEFVNGLFPPGKLVFPVVRP
jgi:hypothetical protein